MPDKNLNLFFRFNLYAIVLAVFLILKNPAYAQSDDLPTFEESQESVESLPQENTAVDNEAALPIPSGDTATQTTAEETIGNADEGISENNNNQTQNSGFDVFRPSEEISEDLAVPFPADI